MRCGSKCCGSAAARNTKSRKRQAVQRLISSTVQVADSVRAGGRESAPGQKRSRAARGKMTKRAAGGSRHHGGALPDAVNRAPAIFEQRRPPQPALRAVRRRRPRLAVPALLRRPALAGRRALPALRRCRGGRRAVRRLSAVAAAVAGAACDPSRVWPLDALFACSSNIASN